MVLCPLGVVLGCPKLVTEESRGGASDGVARFRRVAGRGGKIKSSMPMVSFAFEDTLTDARTQGSRKRGIPLE